MSKYRVNKVLGVNKEYTEYIETPEKKPYVSYKIDLFKYVILDDNDPNYINLNYRLGVTKTSDPKENQSRTCTVYIKIFDKKDRKLLEIPILFKYVKVGKSQIQRNTLNIPKINLTGDELNIELTCLGMDRALPEDNIVINTEEDEKKQKSSNIVPVIIIGVMILIFIILILI